MYMMAKDTVLTKLIKFVDTFPVTRLWVGAGLKNDKEREKKIDS